MAGDAFEKRERAAEEVFFRQEERLHMVKRLEGLVKEGKLPQSVLDQVKAATSTDVHHATGVEVSPGVFKDVPQEAGVRKEYVYAHAPGSVPQAPREYSEGEGERLNLAPHTDMGPGRWAPGGDSVFQLANVAEPAANQALPAHEAARLARLSAKAQAMPPPTFLGYRLGAGTPARTMFWGSILAIWGTAALLAASARTMGGGGMSAEGGAREASAPSALGQRVASFFAPWRERARAAPRTREEVEAEESRFVRRLKESMVAGKPAV